MQIFFLLDRNKSAALVLLDLLLNTVYYLLLLDLLFYTVYCLIYICVCSDGDTGFHVYVGGVRVI